jgi:2-iminobutanoate/2-iminopropanoate deaminase
MRATRRGFVTGLAGLGAAAVTGVRAAARPQSVTWPGSEETPMTTLQHRSVTAAGLPAPAGPYSPAQVFGRLVFVSGQGAADPATGRMAGEGIEVQTEQVLKNIAAILEAAGSSLQHVLRCGVFLTDMREFSRMNVVYARMFGAHRPARTTVEVSALPADGLRVEIDAVAYVPE